MAAAACLAAAAVVPAASAKCERFKGRTIERTATVRVLRDKSRTYACSTRTGKRTRLGDANAEPDVLRATRVVVRGPLVGYVLVHTGRGGSSFRIRVLGVQKQKVTVDVSAAELQPPPEDRMVNAGVCDLVLTQDGNAAWIVTDPVVAGGRVEVRAWDGDAASTLAATRRTVYWTDAGQPHAYRFSGA